MRKTTLQMKQLVIAQWEGATGLTYSTLGLDDKGQVWRYDPKCNGWVAYTMKPVDPAVCDGHRR